MNEIEKQTHWNKYEEARQSFISMSERNGFTNIQAEFLLNLDSTRRYFLEDLKTEPAQE